MVKRTEVKVDFKSDLIKCSFPTNFFVLIIDLSNFILKVPLGASTVNVKNVYCDINLEAK